MEQWKDIPGYEGIYQASDMGGVKSLSRPSGARNGKIKIIKERILRHLLMPNGYVRVSLCKKGVVKGDYVHRIVMAAFFGKSELTVDHINSIKTDNRLCNLRYATYRENSTYHFLKQNNTSKYIGVCFNKHEKRWESGITVGKKRIFLGLFDREEDAGEAYQKALREITIKKAQTV